METFRALEGAERVHNHVQTDCRKQDLLHAQVPASSLHKGKKRSVLLQKCLLRIAAGLLAQLVVRGPFLPHVKANQLADKQEMQK